LGFDVDEVALRTAGDRLREEVTLVIEWSIRLRDDEILFAVSGEIIQVTSHAAFFHAAIRRLEEAEIIHARKRRERRDETDVWTFRCFHRANTTIMRRMHVADFETSTIAGETARSESRQAALMGEFRQRIDLIHELAQL